MKQGHKFMPRIQQFSKGSTIIAQGDTEAIAYLVVDGWLQVQRRNAKNQTKKIRLGPGEIVGELGLTGLVNKRTATVIALTDCEVESIDRGALIRLVNGPGNYLMPLLAALFSRLQDCLADDRRHSHTGNFATIEGITPKAQKALCNEKWRITHLPWFFGSHTNPQGVVDLFEDSYQADVTLTDPRVYIRKQHICIEKSEAGGLQVRVMQHGDYCQLDGNRFGCRTKSNTVALEPGRHTLSFGHSGSPFEFTIEA